jgi:8-oxo-dGTP pyrophosphatase MutT (NUDIX family)|tara:strand:- start:36304 stop:36747 length:444 start_codon:yes stop_codon:yes gene_type:complete
MNLLSKMHKQKSCGAVVFKRQNNSVKYLLLHYEEGHWDFPKGKQEKDETEQQTAKREIKEETGITDIIFIKDFKESMNYVFRYDDKVIYKEVIFFLAETSTEEINLSHEHIGYVWMTFENTFSKLTFKNAKTILTKANQFLAKTPNI